MARPDFAAGSVDIECYRAAQSIDFQFDSCTHNKRQIDIAVTAWEAAKDRYVVFLEIMVQHLLDAAEAQLGGTVGEVAKDDTPAALQGTSFY